MTAGTATNRLSAAAREAADGRVTFESIELAPSQFAWWHEAQFDLAGRLTLDNVSLRKLISLAYPASRVNGDPQLIDLYFDIHASWRRRQR